VRRAGEYLEARDAVVGIEHEFRVLEEAQQVDFRSLIDALPLDGRRNDPRDPYAVRCRAGHLVTADGLEAEIATAPIAVAPGVVSEAQRASARAAADLRAVLHGRYRLAGYSTHLNVTVPSALAVHAAHLFAQTFAPALMLLMDQLDAPGLLIRPRLGRLEFGGDYARDAALRAALAMAIGGARLCAARAARGHGDLPPLVRVRADWGRDRFGWYVDRSAFGPDLYAAGRHARLQRRARGTIESGAQLRACWTLARASLRGLLTADEQAEIDRLVDGSLPLPSEEPVDEVPAFDATEAPPSPFCLAAAPVDRPGFCATPLLATWDWCLLELTDGPRTVYLCVPRNELAGVAGRLERGALDATVVTELSRGAARVLASPEQTRSLGFYELLADATTLVTPEPVSLESALALVAAG
jgi:hypothetical protein